VIHATLREEPEEIPLSYLNAYEYCPRRFYYEFVQGEMVVNEFVLAGTLLHQRSDEPGIHHTASGEVRINRLHLYSEELHLTGFADIVEEQDEHIIPIEYKHGKEGKWLNDHVQLCAQALCLEERLPGKRRIPYGLIFYFGSRKRVQVPFTDELRAKTLDTIIQARHIARLPVPPAPLNGKMAVRCRDCSLAPICLPYEVTYLEHGGSGDNTLFDRESHPRASR
jgi:CRISPR-associated exonuclease Cas4